MSGISAVVGSILFTLGVSIPALYSTISLTLSQSINAASAASVGMYTIFFCGCIFLSTRKIPLNDILFTSLIVAYGIAQWIAVYFIDAPLSSDFKRYWDAAGQMAHELQLPIESISDIRALPLYLPLRVLFGGDEWVYRTFNTISIVGIAGCLAVLGSHAGSKTAGQAAALVFLAAPEVVVSGGIPTHDLAGTFLLVLGMTLIIPACHAFAKQSFATFAVLSLLSAGMFWLAELQRFPWFFIPIAATVALALALMLHRSIKVRPMVATVAATLGSLLVLKFALLGPLLGLNQAGEAGPIPTAQILLGVGHSHTSGWYGEGASMGREIRGLDSGEMTNRAVRLLVSEFADDPFSRIENILFKAIRLYELGGQIVYYTSPDDQRFIDFYDAARVGYAILFTGILTIASLLLPWSLFILPRTHSPLSGWIITFSIAVPAILALLLLFFFEKQSRYMWPIYAFGPLLTFSVFASFRQATSTEGLRTVVVSVALFLGTTAAGVLIVIGAWRLAGAAVDRVYPRDSGRILALSKPRSVVPPGATFMVKTDYRVFERRGLVAPGVWYDYFGPYDVSLIAPQGETVSASWRWCGHRSGPLDFEIIGALRMPQENPDHPIIALTVNGSVVDVASIAAREGRFAVLEALSVHPNQRGCVVLDATLTAGASPAGLLIALASLRKAASTSDPVPSTGDPDAGDG